MSDPVTEIAYLPLLPNTDLTTGEGQKVWTETLRTITAQLGCKALFWGRQVENPDTVQFVIGATPYNPNPTFPLPHSKPMQCWRQLTNTQGAQQTGTLLTPTKPSCHPQHIPLS
jgi:hypothetical protein